MQPRIGVGVIVYKEDKILLGKRKNAHGEGKWGFPGGHLEFQEDPHDCAVREVKEETGVEISDVEFLTITNDIFTDKHYVTLFMKCKWIANNPLPLEADKCEVWEWFHPDQFPTALFLPIINLQKKHQL